MYSRCCAVFSALFLTSPFVTLHADSTTDESVLVTFQDWSGSLQQTTLTDGSVLSEYVAKTHSGNTAGASLLVSFTPRFGCSPAISLMLSSEPRGESVQSATLMFSIDQEKQDFPVLIDTGDSVVRYSLNADTQSQQSVRKKLDNASRATVSWEWSEPELGGAANTVNTDEQIVPADQTGETGFVFFSLLGSRMTVSDIEKLCLAHEPIPFDN